MQANDARPPYVQFEQRTIEDREASRTAGCYRGRDVDFAIVTPQGGKDTVERPVTDWFDNMGQQVSEGRFPAQWLRGYREHYDSWKKGMEMAIDGTSVKTWPGASASEVKSLIDLRLFAVEDVARMGEDTMRRVGPGALQLKQRAQAFLDATRDKGKVTNELAAMRSDLDTLKAECQRLRTVLADTDAAYQKLRAESGDRGAQTAAFVPGKK